VNNNAFTNMVVKETLAIATATVSYLRRRHPKVLRALLRKLRIERELPEFQNVARRLYVPGPDPKTGVIEQFDGYLGLREAAVEELKARRVHPNEYLGAGQGLAVPTKIIKQADVVMMLSLFRTRFSSRIKKLNWEYYEPRTEHGSSLSACAYAMVAAEFGNLGFAYDYFLKTAKIDLEAKYKVYVGNVFMGGSHPAANGGAWMTAVLGFGGLQADEKRVAINPRLWRKWRRLNFHLAYKGDDFWINITRTSVTVAALGTNTRTHTVLVAGRPVKCGPGSRVTVKYRRAR
jgi:kojibiose phosphorylase